MFGVAVRCNGYQIKLTSHIDREIAARPELIQIENGWRNAREQRPGAVQRGHFREIETVVENPDAEPAPPCAAAKPAIIILYGKRAGITLTVCTDDDCPVHDPRAAEKQAANPAPTMAPAPKAETQEEAEVRQRNYEQQRKEYEQEQERKAAEPDKAQVISEPSPRAYSGSKSQYEVPKWVLGSFRLSATRMAGHCLLILSLIDEDLKFWGLQS